MRCGQHKVWLVESVFFYCKECEGEGGAAVPAPKWHTELERIYNTYHHPDYLGLDPLVCLESFSKPADLEIAGLIASSLAYGRVERIIFSVNELLKRMDGKPAAFVSETSFRDKRAAFADFKHRFNDGGDVALLLEVARQTIERWGSLESVLVAGMAKTDGTMHGGLAVYTDELIAIGRQIAGRKKSSYEYLLPCSTKGSACKRINMYFRWMIRPGDGIDLGVWKSISPSTLIMPVDVHVARIAKAWGLSRRNTPDWRMAEEITAKLREVDPTDPVRFDFSLCRYGMLR
ncbi:MAG: TIGR02757 family protein, partial [Chitinivibrionales bacterium]|nr:TIGR02757 family protein [Chitinivibrionales bacterium]